MWTLNEPRLTGKFLKRASTSKKPWLRFGRVGTTENSRLRRRRSPQISQYSKPSFYNMLEKGGSNGPDGRARHSLGIRVREAQRNAGGRKVLGLRIMRNGENLLE